MNDPTWADPSLAKLGASVMGSFVSLRFIAGTWPERLLMFVGGAALSYYSTEPVAEWVGGGPQTLGLIGFTLGLLGMTLVSKVYEAIQAIDSKVLSDKAVAWLAKKWSA